MITDLINYQSLNIVMYIGFAVNLNLCLNHKSKCIVERAPMNNIESEKNFILGSY